MSGLKALPGMVDALNDAVLKRGTPFLGICVGMQLMAKVGREFGDHPGLGWIDGEVVRMTPSDTALKIPQIGWNNITGLYSTMVGHVPENSYMYFVHSYYAALGADTVATTNYVINYSAALQKDNFYAVQFHPEKSATEGAKILENFLKL